VGAPRCGDLTHRAKELLEPISETRGCGNEVSRTRRDQPLGAERSGEGVTDSLECRRVIARCHESRDTRLAQAIQRRPCLTRQAAAVCATDAAQDLLGKRALVGNGSTGKSKELPEYAWVCVDTVCQNGVAHDLEMSDLAVVGNQMEKRRLDQRQ